MRLRIAIVILLASMPGEALAEEAASVRDTSWNSEAWVLACLGIAAVWYGIGVARLRRRHILAELTGWPEITAFSAGIFVLLVALVSPVDTIADQLFSVHMLQHLLLLLVAPPLLVVGRPVIPMLWAFGPASRKTIGRSWTRAGLARAVEWLMQPVLVWLLFMGAFAFWHLPGPYQTAVRNELLHTFEHLSFFVTALMFWTIVLEPSGRRRLGYGATLVFVATSAVVSGLPGALIFLAPRPLYPVHAADAAAWGIPLLEDQQLAGVVMWVPAGLIYVVAVVWVMAQWLDAAQQRTRVPKPAAQPLVVDPR